MVNSRYSLNLGKPFGIRVSVHWTFSLLIAWIVLISVRQDLGITQILMHILFILTLFLCVALHELGHSLTAIRLGGQVQSIILLPIGGLANITEMPEKPRDEFLISAAGPMVNIIIAGILWIYLSLFHPAEAAQIDLQAITFNNFPYMLLAANLFIVAFNLIPAFPMDGGRLFRSALAMKMNRMKATRIAMDIGQVFAVIFIFTGLFFNPFLILIGFFVLLGARGEYEMMKYKYILNNYTVRDILKTDYEKLDQHETLGVAAEKLTSAANRGFVITSGGNYAGILTRNALLRGLNVYGKNGIIKEVMATNVEPVHPDMTLFDVYRNMQMNKYDMVPVRENEEFKGVLDLENINEFFMIQKAMQ
jgi:Zn-dependent protease/predicted transcriptional regulator